MGEKKKDQMNMQKALNRKMRWGANHKPLTDKLKKKAADEGERGQETKLRA